MGLFRRVALAVGRPAAPPRAVSVDPSPAERELVAARAALLVADTERASWKGRAGAFAGYGPRHGHGAATHVGGPEGSAARSLPRDLPGAVIVTLTDRRLVVSAEPAPGTPPVEVASFERADVRWIACTGGRDAAGIHVRCSLADESFFDLAIAHGQAAAFLAVAADLAR